MAFNFLTNLDADDIFISYSRRDGSAYLTGLDAALSKRGFSCFTDKRGTDAGRLPPETLYRKVRGCKTLVLLATPGAQERPENITPELEKFAEANGTSRIICVSFDGGEAFDDFPEAWNDFVIGKAREREAPEALKTGRPSESVVAAVAAASDYMKSKDRLRKYRNRAIGVLAMLVALSAGAAGLAWYQLERAADATAKADAETKKASEATARAEAETARAAKATQEAKDAQDEAERQKAEAKKQRDEADKQKEVAARATKDAQEKTKLADAATRRAQEASARADREQTIAEARSLANRSQTLLRERPEELPRATSLAADSMKKFTSVGLHGLEADTALRETLALLPRFRRIRRYESAPEPALSPDGRHYATLDWESTKLRVYANGMPAQSREFECECTRVALSNGPDYAAAVTTDGRVKIFDLNEPTRSRFLQLPEGISPQDIALNIALSPGGRYVALTGTAGSRDERYSMLFVLDLTSGAVMAPFRNPRVAAATANPQQETGSCARLDMLINDVAFSPNGNLAVGGGYRSSSAGRVTGRVALWSLPLAVSDGQPEPQLSDVHFTDVEIVPLPSEVRVVAPGEDLTYFATDAGVWKKPTGQTTYQPFTRILKTGTDPNELIGQLTFADGGRKLVALRSVSKLPSEEGDGNIPVLETWDVAGHRDLLETQRPDEIDYVSFKPGGQFLAAVSLSSDAEMHAEMRQQRSPGHAFNILRADDGSVAGSFPVTPGREDGRIIHVSQDSAYFVTTTGVAATVWDVWGEQKAAVPFEGALKGSRVAAVSPGGKFLALAGEVRNGGGQLVVIYRSEGGRFVERNRLRVPWPPADMSLSGDGRRLAVISRGLNSTPEVWDVGTGREITPEGLRKYRGGRRLLLSHSGRFLAALDTGTQARLFDLGKGEEANLLDNTLVLSAVFSPDGRYLALGTREGLLHVFETERLGNEIARLQHGGKVTAVAFSEGGRYLASASSDRQPYRPDEGVRYPLRIWLLEPADLLAEAEGRLEGLRELRR